MSKGNITCGHKNAQFYVDYNNFNTYLNKNNPEESMLEKDIPSDKLDDYEFDMELTQIAYETFKGNLINHMQSHYKSLQKVIPSAKAEQKIILENNMFQIALMDNDWSIAVQLLRKPKYTNEAFQNRLFPTFLNGIVNALFDQVDVIHERTSSWTSTSLYEQTKSQSIQLKAIQQPIPAVMPAAN